ncbi:nitrogen regulation protein NR(II) [Shewanella gelidii]|uniref:Sensory histidine kinase/phosphatase NtrB n=1 Tax=Shewanella gelidii TaxID=1642821 RepID=A0A917JT38_9GAMM|nr:nitrogen regulation protein NR(II) [Shewanella gelidii]MCL1098470.1 nitrogen regulation protein NR(II) [Shewanella gelidii]GGI82520.1 two-component system sensor histidine kinase NtrB [Shewanella gelidii]
MDTENLLNHLVTIVMVIDCKLKPKYANTAAEQLLGVSRHKITEHALPDYFQMLGIGASVLQGAVVDGQSLTINTVPLVTLDGQQHTADITLTPLAGNSPDSLLELRLVDQQLRIHQQLTQDAQQQAAQYLVRNLAHEIKNPLGGLRGAAQLLSRELNDPDQQEFTSMIIEQADRLRGLVDRLLGPQKPSHHSSNNIHQVIQKVLQLTQISQPQNVTIERDYDPSIPDFEMDADQMQQAILNIIQNATQALEEKGGHIRIRTRTRHQVTLGSERYKLVLELSIIDNGPGIPPELMDTLFYPMVTGRSDGSGLGLSITHNIARLHGGRIDCISNPGHTEFILSLPIKSSTSSTQ